MEGIVCSNAEIWKTCGSYLSVAEIVRLLHTSEKKDHLKPMLKERIQ
jgi:hypothetical protein